MQMPKIYGDSLAHGFSYKPLKNAKVSFISKLLEREREKEKKNQNINCDVTNKYRLCNTHTLNRYHLHSLHAH